MLLSRSKRASGDGDNVEVKKYYSSNFDLNKIDLRDKCNLKIE